MFKCQTDELIHSLIERSLWELATADGHCLMRHLHEFLCVAIFFNCR